MPNFANQIAPTNNASRFAVLEANRDSDRSRWLNLWSQSPTREVFAHPAYLEFSSEVNETASCAVWDDGINHVLYPFLRRPIEPHEGIGTIPSACDLSTPNGYGGPYWWGASRSDTALAFWDAFDAWAQRRRVVSEFIRFDLRREQLLSYRGTVSTNRPNLVVNLSLDEAVLWSSFEHKVRKNVKRAQRAGIKVVVDLNAAQIDDFVEVYDETMNRRSVANHRRIRMLLSSVTHEPSLVRCESNNPQSRSGGLTPSAQGQRPRLSQRTHPPFCR
jgi:hypothetical protein